MAPKSKDDKLRDTLKKHEFDEEAAKKLESTANKNIQSIFDKSRSADDTGVTQINAAPDDLEEKKEIGEIVIDMSEEAEGSIDIEDDDIDLGGEDFDEIKQEFQELRPEIEDAEELDFSNSEDEIDLSDIENEDGSSIGSDVLNFSVTEENEDSLIAEKQESTNLIDALVSAQSVENEFAEDSDEDFTLDEIFDAEGGDELAPTMVDINQKDILNRIDDDDDIVQNLLNETKVEEETDDNRFESEIISQDEPSFRVMPEGMESLNSDQASLDDEIEQELKEHKEFDFTAGQPIDDGLEATKIDATSKIHQDDDNEEGERRALPQAPVNFLDDDATRVTSYNEAFVEDKTKSMNSTEAVEDEEATRILDADEHDVLKDETRKIDHEESPTLTQQDFEKEDRKETPSYTESEMLKHQSTIRLLREDRQGLLDEIETLKEKNQMLHKSNLNLKAELDELQIEITIIRKRHEEDLGELRYNLNFSEDKKKMLEEKLKRNQEELSNMGERVRVDLDKLRRKEKDLENQLELVQMDTANQVQNRENKILELKRKIDALEFNMENTVVKEQKAREDKKKLEDRLRSIMKTLRGSIRLLEEDINIDEELFKPSSDM